MNPPVDCDSFTGCLQDTTTDLHIHLCQSTTPIQTASLGDAMPWRPGYKPTPCGSMCQLVLHITTAAPAPGSAACFELWLTQMAMLLETGVSTSEGALHTTISAETAYIRVA